MVFGAVMQQSPNIIFKAISPFSAVETLHPIRVSIRFMRVRVNGSSSTTRTSKHSGPEDELKGNPPRVVLCVAKDGDDSAVDAEQLTSIENNGLGIGT